MSHKYRQIRKQILLKWLRNHYPAGSYITNVKLGTPKSLYFPRSRYGKRKGVLFNLEAIADAVVFLPNEIHMVKISINPNSRTLKKLLKCEKAFKRTDRFKDWWYLPITKILLIRDLNPLLNKKIRDLGINLRTFNKYDFYQALNPHRLRKDTFSYSH